MNAISIKSQARKPTPRAVHKDAALRAHTALAEMINGTARRSEWVDCANALNVVDALGSMGKYELATVRPLVEKANEGLQVAIKCPDGMMRMGGDATKALKQVVCLYDEAIGKFSRATIDDALRMVEAIIADPRAAEEGRLIVVDA